MNSYMYGLECSICHEVNPNGRYQSHESRFCICGKHTRQEVDDWQSQPAEQNRKARRAAKKVNKPYAPDDDRCGNCDHHAELHGSRGCTVVIQVRQESIACPCRWNKCQASSAPRESEKRYGQRTKAKP